MPTNINAPLFVLGGAPMNKIEFPNFFDSDSALVELLRNPPYLRYSGWNMRTLDTPKIVKGKCWEVRNGDRKTIRLYRDGSFVSVVYADNTFLGWGQNDEGFAENPRLNTLALIEYVYEFVSLYTRVLSNTTSDVKQLRFDSEFKNTKVGEKYLTLVPQRISDPFFSAGFNEGETKEDFSTTVVINYEENNDVGFIAYKILESIFIKFEIPADMIPYTNTNGSGARFIDIEQIPQS